MTCMVGGKSHDNGLLTKLTLPQNDIYVSPRSIRYERVSSNLGINKLVRMNAEFGKVVVFVTIFFNVKGRFDSGMGWY